MGCTEYYTDVGVWILLCLMVITVALLDRYDKR